MKRIKQIAVVLFIVACNALVPCAHVSAETIRIGCGGPVKENIVGKIEGRTESDIGITLNVTVMDPVQAWKSLDEGKIDAAIIGLPLAYWKFLVEKENHTVGPDASYVVSAIAHDKIVILTNKDVGISELSDENVMGLFTGTIKRWSEIGGPDQEVKVVVATKIKGTNELFKYSIMNNQPFRENAIKVDDITKAKEMIINTPGALGLGAQSQADNTVNTPKYPWVKRDILLMTKAPMPKSVSQLLNYIRSEGGNHIYK